MTIQANLKAIGLITTIADHEGDDKRVVLLVRDEKTEDLLVSPIMDSVENIREAITKHLLKALARKFPGTEKLIAELSEGFVHRKGDERNTYWARFEAHHSFVRQAPFVPISRENLDRNSEYDPEHKKLMSAGEEYLIENELFEILKKVL